MPTLLNKVGLNSLFLQPLSHLIFRQAVIGRKKTTGA
jgi:hypothetical protein